MPRDIRRAMGILYSEPICQAAYENNVQEVHNLLQENSKNLNIQDSCYRDTALIAACRQGHLRTVKYLLHQKADTNIKNEKKRTCLHYVIRNTYSYVDYLIIIILMPVLLIGFFIMEQKKRRTATLVSMILNTGVDVNAVDYKGNTALHYACKMRSTKIVPLLMEKTADLTIKNQDGESPLDIAERLKFPKIVQMLKKSS